MKNINTISIAVSVILIIFCLCSLLYFFSYRKKINYTKLLLQRQCYLINLDKRSDRLKVTVPMLKTSGFIVERFPAISYNDDLINLVKEDARYNILKEQRNDHYELSKGGIGCFLSHIQIWEKIQNSKDSHGIIFEDDVLPSRGGISDIQSEISKVPDDWDIILIGALYLREINSDVSKIYKFYGTHAYIINKKVIPYLLKNVFPMEMQIDAWLSKLAEESKINIYGLNNIVWMQNPEINNTDIQIPLDDFKPLFEL